MSCNDIKIKGFTMAKQEIPKRKAGRPKGAVDSYRRTKIKSAVKLKRLGRKIDDYIDEALQVAATIMRNPNAQDKDRLAAAKMFIERFATLERDVAISEQWMNKPIEAPASSEEENTEGKAVFQLFQSKQEDNQ